MSGRLSAAEYQITVAPVEGGWSVRLGDSVHPILFLSGARAERHARDLARRLSDAGADAQVLVHDRSLAVVGATRYAAAPQYESSVN